MYTCSVLSKNLVIGQILPLQTNFCKKLVYPFLNTCNFTLHWDIRIFLSWSENLDLVELVMGVHENI